LLGISSLADIYIAAVSASHNVAAKDVWIAEVSTIVETSVPEREILPGLQLLGTVVDKYVSVLVPFSLSLPLLIYSFLSASLMIKLPDVNEHPLISRFISITPLYAPTSPGTDENIFITKSYDATSHFETVVEDVFDVWQRVKGEPLVLKKREVEVEA
jgi:Rab GDP dissociation inhibitor